MKNGIVAGLAVALLLATQQLHAAQSNHSIELPGVSSTRMLSKSSSDTGRARLRIFENVRRGQVVMRASGRVNNNTRRRVKFGRAWTNAISQCVFVDLNSYCSLWANHLGQTKPGVFPTGCARFLPRRATLEVKKRGRATLFASGRVSF